MDPSITVEAPKASALVMCPTDLIPPSAITGTPNLEANNDTEKIAFAYDLPHAQTS